MTTDRPQVNPTSRYTINQTRALLGIARSTLYEWERRGYIKSHIHRHTMRRFYTGADIVKCWIASI